MPATLSVRVRLTPTQRAFHRSDARYRGFVAGIGAGKSWAGAYDLIRRARPGRLYMAAAPTFPMMRDATLRTFASLARGLHFLAGLNRSDLTATLGNGAEVLFRSADDPERWRGPNLSGVWLDEASLMVRSAFDVAIGRLREAGEQGWLSATFTPKGRVHWTYDLFGRGAPDTALFHARTGDNPFLPPEFTAGVARQYGGLLSQQELEGAFVDLGAGLFRAEHLSRVAPGPPHDAVRRVRYWDKGYSARGDYTVGVLMSKTAGGLFFVEHVVRGRWEPHERNRVIRATAEWDKQAHGRPVKQFVEEPPGAGHETTQQLLRELAGYPCEAVKPRGDKAERAEPFAAQCAAGNVYFVGGPWLRDFVDEALSFPEGAQDDQVDAAVGAFGVLTMTAGGSPAAYGGPAFAQAPPPAGVPRGLPNPFGGM
jgi:predicted phage terminase large subunit-like protein